MTGIRERTSFRSYLGRKKLTCLIKVLGKANDFIWGEEFDKAATAKRPEGDGKEKQKGKYRKDKNSDSSGRKEENNSVKKGQEGRNARYRNYTPLTMSRVEIYELHKKDDTWQWPRKMYYKRRNKLKWCEFDRDYGHVTDDFKDLKDIIEDLVRRGYFTQYEAIIDRKSPSREDDNDNRKSVKDRITKIHVISGGSAHGGSIHGAKACLNAVRHQGNYHNTR